MSSNSSLFAKTPEPPYYAVIFTSQRTEGEQGYDQMAERMLQCASEQSGFLGMESVRRNDGFGITVSYWETLESISLWKQHSEHRIAQETGKRLWYQHYELRISKVERAYSK